MYSDLWSKINMENQEHQIIIVLWAGFHTVYCSSKQYNSTWTYMLIAFVYIEKKSQIYTVVDWWILRKHRVWTRSLKKLMCCFGWQSTDIFHYKQNTSNIIGKTYDIINHRQSWTSRVTLPRFGCPDQNGHSTWLLSSPPNLASKVLGSSTTSEYLSFFFS